MSAISTKPYLLRAIYEWCNDCGYTPYLSVTVDERTVVPFEHVVNGEIVLNVSPAATHALAAARDIKRDRSGRADLGPPLQLGTRH